MATRDANEALTVVSSAYGSTTAGRSTPDGQEIFTVVASAFGSVTSGRAPRLGAANILIANASSVQERYFLMGGYTAGNILKTYVATTTDPAAAPPGLLIVTTPYAIATWLQTYVA